jgi:HEAT repeat protein
MAHRRVEEQIEALRQLADAGPSPAAVAALRKALADRTGLIVAKAAKVAAALQAHELVPDLVRAFNRLLEKPVERDPQCWGKNAIVKTLTEFDHCESAVFLRGSRHVQMEAVWGGQEDTASTLRGICVLGLASCTDLRREEILRCLVDRLTDPAYTVRVEAVRAVAQMAGDEAALLLRLKARAGDEEPRVTGQVFDCLLQVEGEPAVEFVAELMQAGTQDVASEAALALGSSRLESALPALEGAWSSTHDADLRLAVLRGLSASRQERAFAFLFDLVKKGRAHDAALAIEALTLHRESEDIRRRIEAVANEAGPEILEIYRKAFR